MPADSAIHGTGRGLHARLAGPAFADKMAVALGAVIALLSCAVILAGLGAHAARDNADNVKHRHLPLIETAFALEAMVYESIFHASMFGSSGDMASYSAARVRFGVLRETASTFALQASAIPDTKAVSRDMEVMRERIRQLDLVVEKKRTLSEALIGQRNTLRRIADDMDEALATLQTGTVAAPGMVSGRGVDKARDEKARLLVLGGFALAVEEATGQALAAGVARNAADLASAEAYFVSRWNEARESVVAADGSGAGLADMEKYVAEYRETVGSMLYYLEEIVRLNGEREAVTGSLVMLTREILALVRENMADAVTRADTALRGATATLFACAILACMLGAGSVMVFVRSSKGSGG